MHQDIWQKHLSPSCQRHPPEGSISVISELLVVPTKAGNTENYVFWLIIVSGAMWHCMLLFSSVVALILAFTAIYFEIHCTNMLQQVTGNIYWIICLESQFHLLYAICGNHMCGDSCRQWIMLWSVKQTRDMYVCIDVFVVDPTA